MISCRSALMVAAAMSLAACAREAAVAPEAAPAQSAASVAEPALEVAAPAKWTARGQEPGWILTIENGKADFSYAYGEKSHTAVLPPSQAIEGGIEYFEKPGGLAVTVLNAPCADVMSGLPYPETVTVTLGDEVFKGCGGDTESLLTGAAWQVETIRGERLVGGFSVTMMFDPKADNVGGSGGCNSYGAPYTLTGEGLAIGDPTYTEKACDGALMTQESAFLEALVGITMFSVDETGALRMDGPDGERITARR
jgi:heat shock protein HslJ